MLQIIDDRYKASQATQGDSSRANRLQHQGLAVLLCGLCWIGWAIPASANTPEEWVELGTQVHGGFGSYIALGIRIGLDARERLQAEPRELAVTYYSAATAPCPCVVDGVMLATVATPGQNSLRVADTPSPPETFGIVEVQHKATGAAIQYLIPASARELLDNWNQTLDPVGRFQAVMNAPAEQLLFVTEENPSE